jgi:purine-nucleoside phosphorylase
MKEKLKQILDTCHKYNSEHMMLETFGLRDDIMYDAFVVAPSFTPYKLHMDQYCKVTTLRESAYLGGYLVEKDDLKIAWIKTASSASNLIDHLTLSAELSFKKVIFIGAVGALKENFHVGDVCTPSYSISGSYADSFLMKESIRDNMLFSKVYPDKNFIDEVIGLGKKRGYDIRIGSVFCTPSIALEYIHLDELRSFDTDLIEMETSSFYLVADLLEVPAIALLVVSDNSATGVALVGRTDEEQEQYDKGRNVVLPDMILAVAEM